MGGETKSFHFKLHRTLAPERTKLSTKIDMQFTGIRCFLDSNIRCFSSLFTFPNEDSWRYHADDR